MKMSAYAKFLIRFNLQGNLFRYTRNSAHPKYVHTNNYKYYAHQPFLVEKDRYNGVTVDTTSLKCSNEVFIETLKISLRKWAEEGRRCIWFKVYIKDSHYVPVLAQKGFNFHHARDDYVMMYKWLPPDLKPNLPPACHTNVGVGAFVVNDTNQMLAISEKHYEYPHWKLPGGYVERGEGIVNAAKREVKEETGVDTKFLSLITFRHTHNMMYGNSDIYILLMMKALSNTILVSEREVMDCKWMEIDEYINHPHVHAFNSVVIKQALECREKNIKLDIQNKTIKWAAYTRDIDFLHIASYDDE